MTASGRAGPGVGRLSRHQQECLEAMGVTAWIRRDAPAPRPLATSGGEVAEHAEGGEADGDVAGMDWATLVAAVESCRRCPLHQSRTRAVPGVGARDARVMIVGEAPGAEEDRRGEPFVGRAGWLLDRMLAAIGLDRSTVFITNVLKSRPPGNRDPAAEEVAACEPFLRRQIELLQPDTIVAVGRIAAQQLLRSDRPLGRLRGDWHRYGPVGTPLLVTYHPAYLLRNPAAKRQAWQDLRRVRDQLRRSAP